jgi:hypothetical protein
MILPLTTLTGLLVLATGLPSSMGQAPSRKAGHRIAESLVTKTLASWSGRRDKVKSFYCEAQGTAFHPKEAFVLGNRSRY